MWKNQEKDPTMTEHALLFTYRHTKIKLCIEQSNFSLNMTTFVTSPSKIRFI